MIVSLFSVKDKVSDTFGKILEQNNNAEAMRSFSDIVKNPESVISKHPQDYDLYLVGTFDTSSGITDQIITCLANGADYLKAQINSKDEFMKKEN
jgi:hypothetical protein